MKKLGSIIGSGGLIVIDEQTCMVDLAKFFMAFCADESCGKCVPCRAGTVQLHRLLDRISNGSGSSLDMKTLEELCGLVKDTSLCGLGQSAPNPVLSTLRFFRDEYETHLRERRCPAGQCQINEVPIMDLIELLPRQIQAARRA
jgi:bidirectional [NiFe] hydrogenase diaphorase subunit